jgi:GT2 family glycosyltransferase
MMDSTTILIPNYNGVNFIKDTVESFKKSFPECEIVVVDDASTDESVDVLALLDITLLIRETNGGFAAGVNTGLRYLVSRGINFIIVSNSDINIDVSIAQKIQIFVDELQAKECRGVIGFIEANDPDSERRIGDKVCGFFFGLDSCVIEKVGYFDEKFIMYGEEQDYFRRVLNAGFQIVQSNIFIPHEGEKSGGGLRNSWLAMRNALRLEIKFLSARKIIRTLGSLFLMINRIYRPKQDGSVIRILRPGILMGNIMLLFAVIWNIVMLPWTLWDRKNEH